MDENMNDLDNRQSLEENDSQVITDVNANTNTTTNPEVKVVVVNEPRKKKKRFNIFKFLVDVVLFLLFAIIIASSIFVFLNTQNICEGKEPVCCLKQDVQERNNEIKTTCDLGVFRIVKVEDSKETVISFKPFFLAD